MFDGRYVRRNRVGAGFRLCICGSPHAVDAMQGTTRWRWVRVGEKEDEEAEEEVITSLTQQSALIIHTQSHMHQCLFSVTMLRVKGAGLLRQHLPCVLPGRAGCVCGSG
jgi:hypothetical protein